MFEAFLVLIECTFTSRLDLLPLAHTGVDFLYQDSMAISAYQSLYVKLLQPVLMVYQHPVCQEPFHAVAFKKMGLVPTLAD